MRELVQRASTGIGIPMKQSGRAAEVNRHRRMTGFGKYHPAVESCFLYALYCTELMVTVYFTWCKRSKRSKHSVQQASYSNQ